MKLDMFKSDFAFIRKSNNTMLYSNSILASMLAVSLVFNMNKDVIVINGVNESCTETSMGASSMNKANHERLGFYLAGQLGNITPDTADFVKGAVMPFIAPNIYQEVSEAIDIQLAGLVEDELTIHFTPDQALFEDGVTFISGKTVITGPTGDKDGSIRTYEFEFDVQNYTPTVTFLTVYDDIPHNKEWKRKYGKQED
jgi:conjugal transfer pilus assembly protein TraE